MTKLEYGAVPHNSGENRNPMDRDSVGLNITKQALEPAPTGVLIKTNWDY